MQLLASKRARYQQFVLIIQFNDMIASAWLSDKAAKDQGGFEEVCRVGSMARIKMDRTIKETVFFIEQSDDGDCINSIEISSSKPRKLNVYTVFTLAGQTVVMLGADDEDDVHDFQKLWVICDNQKVYQISNGVAQNEASYAVVEEFDLALHDLEETMAQLRNTDWSTVFISKRALTLFCKVYSVSSDSSFDVVIPDDATSKFRCSNWHVLSIQIMANTSNMIVMGINDKNQFCLMKRPRPGMKKSDLIGSQFYNDINDMYFVSDKHVVLEKKDR